MGAAVPTVLREDIERVEHIIQVVTAALSILLLVTAISLKNNVQNGLLRLKCFLIVQDGRTFSLAHNRSQSSLRYAKNPLAAFLPRSVLMASILTATRATCMPFLPPISRGCRRSLHCAFLTTQSGPSRPSETFFPRFCCCAGFPAPSII